MTTWPPFRRQHFQVHFLDRNILNLKYDFTGTCSLGSNWQYGNISSYNGLAPNRRQAISWSNVGMFYWRIYASFSLNDILSWKRFPAYFSSVIPVDFFQKCPMICFHIFYAVRLNILLNKYGFARGSIRQFAHVASLESKNKSRDRI